MSTTDTVAAVLIDYLQATLGSLGPIDAEADLLDSGRLDSLAVMDLVCFLEVHDMSWRLRERMCLGTNGRPPGKLCQ